MPSLPQPVPPTLMLRLLVVVIVVLAFLAGFYHSALQVEIQKNQQLQSQLESNS